MIKVLNESSTSASSSPSTKRWEVIHYRYAFTHIDKSKIVYNNLLIHEKLRI